jgi:uncharacterized membrane protein YfcA
MWIEALLFVVGMWVGVQNALAGGGSFVTLPALILSGLDARAANIASTIALYPGQMLSGWVGRRNVGGIGGLSFRALSCISIVGGAVGAVLLLLTPSDFFELLVPWLVLLATAIFAYGSFRPHTRPAEHEAAANPRQLRGAALLQFVTAIYGGYFGGGIGFVMLAVLIAVGMEVRRASATKNMLAGIINTAAVAIFVFTPGIPWTRVIALCLGAMFGGYGGAKLLQRVNEKLIRAVVVLLGIALTIGLFLRHPG